MMNGGFDAASDARFRATVEIETKHIHKQIELLWQHNHKRRAEIVMAQKHLAKEIETIKSRINGAIYSIAAALAAALWVLVKGKLGF